MDNEQLIEQLKQEKAEQEKQKLVAQYQLLQLQLERVTRTLHEKYLDTLTQGKKQHSK